MMRYFECNPKLESSPTSSYHFGASSVSMIRRTLLIRSKFCALSRCSFDLFVANIQQGQASPDSNMAIPNLHSRGIRRRNLFHPSCSTARHSWPIARLRLRAHSPIWSYVMAYPKILDTSRGPGSLPRFRRGGAGGMSASVSGGRPFSVIPKLEWCCG